jgi:SAM-dependent methyltransferase
MRVYLTDTQALAWFHRPATPDFWDGHWRIDDLRRYLLASTDDGLFIPTVRRHLPPGSTVLDGGCGRGQLVHALQVNRYRAVGIDFAGRTVQAIHQAMPELDVRVGDVRALPLADGSLDGYLSVGVIEHFWGGYGPILAEIQRTLRPGGFLFVSFPHLSPLRRWKVNLRAYPTGTKAQYEDCQNAFYQFGLRAGQVQRDLERLSFRLVERRTYDGIKGFKDEVTWLKPWLQPIYDGKRGHRLRRHLDRWLKHFASHCVLLVMRKTTDVEGQ